MESQEQKSTKAVAAVIGTRIRNIQKFFLLMRCWIGLVQRLVMLPWWLPLSLYVYDREEAP